MSDTNSMQVLYGRNYSTSPLLSSSWFKCGRQYLQPNGVICALGDLFSSKTEYTQSKKPLIYSHITVINVIYVIELLSLY